MTCLMSPLKRAAPTTGSGCYGLNGARMMMRKIVYFLVGACKGRSAIYTPPAHSRYRACREGSWEGGRSLVGKGDSVVPCGGHDVSP
jgi:hypothetical protein